MKLTKFSQNNLRVIQNFLVYAQLEDQLGQMAINYISEDHVDGEESPEAIHEIALSCEMILEGVYMANDENEERHYTVYVDDDDASPIMYAVSNTTNEVLVYGLVGDQDEIANEHRDEILEYRLGDFTPDDEVCLGDIFMHGKYTKLISTNVW